MRYLSILTLLVLYLTGCSTEHNIGQPADIKPVTFEKVRLEDNFWRPRLETQKQTLVPHALEQTELAVENLRRTGDFLKYGSKQKLLKAPRYVASDLFKVMEGAAYLLTLEKDEALEKQMDKIIDIIADAQCADGYLYEFLTVEPSMAYLSKTSGYKPYTAVEHSHELYNMGHMYEAAIAYFKATGKRKFLDIAEKSAQHINKVFFEGDPAYNDGKPVNRAPGHEEIELALVKLYEATGNRLYLDMAKQFVDIRGVSFTDTTILGGLVYSQQHLPVREQRTAEGHSVRALYLYSAMADIYSHFADATLLPALDAIWHNIADAKIHINGGLGSVAGHEGFGPEYNLPNVETYDETCAAVGNVFFNYRMFLATGDAKYIDMAEISLYNNVLAGVNLEGNRFFYVNVLQTDGKRAFNRKHIGRFPWYGTACCPSNMARLIPQISGMIYSHGGNDIYCGLYAGSSANIPLESGNVNLRQSTGYPFDGNVEFVVTPEKAGTEFTVHLRIPTWCKDRFIPGELYKYTDNADCGMTVRLNGKKIRTKTDRGFIPITKVWQAGDRISLNIDMPVRYNVADERVEADRNKVCITRGPLVYCAEEPDNSNNTALYIIKETDQETNIDEFEEGVMKGIKNITMNVSAINENDSLEKEARLTLIPYYSWGNRGNEASMNVWFARNYTTAKQEMK